MIEELQPYSEYKESGSKWLGRVPDSWRVRTLRTLLTKRNERNRPDLPLLSVAREKGVFVRSLEDDDENHNVIPEDPDQLQSRASRPPRDQQDEGVAGFDGNRPVRRNREPGLFRLRLRH